ncbi:hypothetical protein FB567DRAFT_516101 [Paraphoma chrysanthemicola]|uniref:BTB domain-containing protein n=1 Tax=Paraphoma chrysanthemicola TaxID=798071 RepID=A0A8K0RF96_9PLEO|nr:hypothetical protein FB567DRAFT_516101 [Paraphoma chrysanthemicola]
MPVIAAPCEGETTMLLNEPAEDNVRAGEEAVVSGSPSNTPSTREDSVDARRELKLDECTISPYACKPVAIDCGPGLATYWVPEYLLRSLKWPSTEGEGTLCLPGVSAATGHTLVHYLYTGKYQALGAKEEGAVAPAHIEFEQALLTFILATAYDLSDLESLAKEQITKSGSCMTLAEVLNTARNEFPELAWSWFHEYLQARAKEQFDVDHTYFTRGAYINSVGVGPLHTFMACYLLETFSEKLTLTLQGRESHCLGEEIPEAVLNGVEEGAEQSHCCLHRHGGHRTGVCTGSDETSFEFLDAACDASREDADAATSLESSAWDKITPTSSDTAPVPSPGPGPSAQAEPIIELKLKSTKKETIAAKRVRERRERKEREEQERLQKAAAEKEEEERLAREAEEAATAAEEARIEAEEAEAARIAVEEAEAEAASLAVEEGERRRAEREISGNTGWAASIWNPSKRKESMKERKAREKREREASRDADWLAAEEQARIQVEEAEAKAARIAAEDIEQRCPRCSTHLLESNL